MSSITGLHHLGLVVRDAPAAVQRYRRLGFHLPTLTFPSLAEPDGQPGRAFGAGNSHIWLGSSFVELATVVDGPLPDDALLHPIHADQETLGRLTAAIDETSSRLRAALDRFEGLHILAFGTDNVDAAATRLSASGVWHGGVHRLQRPPRPGSTGPAQPLGYLELDRPSQTPEGRLAVAETITASEPVRHPNGATALVEVVLCVPDDELDAYVDRYRGYVDQPVRRNGPTVIIELGEARLIMVTRDGLASLAPGFVPEGTPALVGYAVAVNDLAVTKEWLRDQQIPYAEANGELQVAAEWALGAFLIFRAKA